MSGDSDFRDFVQYLIFATPPLQSADKIWTGFPRCFCGAAGHRLIQALLWTAISVMHLSGLNTSNEPVRFSSVTVVQVLPASYAEVGYAQI